VQNLRSTTLWNSTTIVVFAVYGLFNGAVGIWVISVDRRVTSGVELERIWKETS
jgi:hypothetical protein